MDPQDSQAPIKNSKKIISILPPFLVMTDGFPRFVQSWSPKFQNKNILDFKKKF